MNAKKIKQYILRVKHSFIEETDENRRMLDIYMKHIDGTATDNEIKKVYSLSNNLTPQPYVPSFKKNAYSKFSRDYSNQHLIDLMQYCYSIDKLIKLGSSQNHIWHNLEVVVTSFVLKKPLLYQTKTEIA